MSGRQPPLWIWIAVPVAVLFGLLTIRSGGAVLFFDGAARQAAGNYVPFVLWFNFLAGFAYVAAGIGLWFRRAWAAPLAAAIAMATILVFAALGIAILTGAGYEMRTVAAMTLRSSIWIVIAAAAYGSGYRRSA